MMSYTYILILFFTIIICFLSSFDSRILFHRHFGAFFKAALVVAVPFIGIFILQLKKYGGLIQIIHLVFLQEVYL